MEEHTSVYKAAASLRAYGRSQSGRIINWWQPEPTLLSVVCRLLFLLFFRLFIIDFCAPTLRSVNSPRCNWCRTADLKLSAIYRAVLLKFKIEVNSVVPADFIRCRRGSCCPHQNFLYFKIINH